MRTSIFVLSLLMIASTAVAQEVKPVATDPADVLDARTLYAFNFGTAAPDSGTVNPHAATATIAALQGTTLFVAIDSEKPDQATPNVLRLNFSTGGKSEEKTFVRATRVAEDGSSINFYGVVQAKVGDATVPITVKSDYRKVVTPDHTYRSITLSLGTGLEARCKIDGKDYVVRLLDGPGMNFKFNDKPYVTGWGLREPGDTVAVYTVPADATQAPVRISQSYYGQPALINGKWYDVSLSADGRKIDVTPFTGSLGKASFNQDDWTARLVGRKYVIRLSGGKEAIELPADEYVLSQTTIFLKRPTSRPASTEPAAPIQLNSRMGNPNDQPHIVISPDKEAKVTFGPPLTLKPIVNSSYSQGVFLVIRMSAVDSCGMPTDLQATDSDIVPRFTVSDSGGKLMGEGVMGFG